MKKLFEKLKAIMLQYGRKNEERKRLIFQLPSTEQ
jgi:hypothetical protein